jgi:hypothetical protein
LGGQYEKARKMVRKTESPRSERAREENISSRVCNPNLHMNSLIHTTRLVSRYAQTTPLQPPTLVKYNHGLGESHVVNPPNLLPPTPAPARGAATFGHSRAQWPISPHLTHCPDGVELARLVLCAPAKEGDANAGRSVFPAAFPESFISPPRPLEPLIAA